MSKSTTLSKTLRTIPFIIVAMILLLQSWLIIKNKQVYKNSEISVHLSTVQEASHAIYSDLVLLRDYLTSEDNEAISTYIAMKVPIHKQWLKEIIYGQNEHHPLVIFSEKYLRLVKGLQHDQINETFATRLDLLELVDRFTQEDNNITILSKQRTVDNHDQLQSNIVTAELLAVLLLILFVFFLFSLNLQSKRKTRANEKSRKLALFFVDYPNALLRLSSSGRIRYYNRQASLLMKTHNINKQALLPQELLNKLDKVIQHPNKTLRFPHQIKGAKLNCDIRLCPDSGQIYMMVSETHNDPMLSKPVSENKEESAIT